MASKSKKRRRVLGASCILAALIIAGSSFAWFTSKDEVTNRLSSNADYGVSIVESFAPPKNWSPGQEINKDVYAINTGTVAAFVNEDVTSKLTYTVERLKTQADFSADSCLTLTADEVDKVKAGAYLAGAFTTAGAKIGTTTGAIAEYFDNGAGTDPKTTDDFTPTVAGLYFFRRSIAVDPTSHSETFKYDGYYFDGAKYYELRDIRPNEAQNYKAGDVDFADGTLTTLPTYKYVVEETNTVTPKLKYDSTNNRLVASYNTNVGATNGPAVDTANYAVTGVGQKLKDLQDAKSALDAQQATYEGYVGQKNAAITTIGFYAGPTNAATIDKASANITILATTDDYSTIAQYTPSNDASIVTPGVLREQIDEYNALVGTAATPNTYLWYEGQIATADGNINDPSNGKQKLYNDANANVNDPATGTQHIFDEAAAAYQTATGHSYTDDIALIGTPVGGTDLYTVWQKDQANKEAKAALATAEQNLANAKADKAQLEAAAAAVKAKLIALSNTINTNQTALDTAIDARDAAAGSATTNDPATHGEKADYEAALTAYNNALKAYNEARATYEANDTTGCDIKVYINLSSDVVTTSSGKDKWLLKPIDVTGETAHFYYTGILESAESSSKLIDSVKLAPEVSQKAYKYFDFDLNVSLDSAQIVYDDDQKTILTTAVTGNAAAFENQKATLAAPQNLETEVLWN